MEEQVNPFYARGVSARDIHNRLVDLYGIDLSADMVSKIFVKILPEVNEYPRGQTLVIPSPATSLPPCFYG